MRTKWLVVLLVVCLACPVISRSHSSSSGHSKSSSSGHSKSSSSGHSKSSSSGHSKSSSSGHSKSSSSEEEERDVSGTPCSCADAMARGFTEDREYEIDPDGEGGEEPFRVYCDMSSGQAVTIVHHNHEHNDRNDRKIDGCEEPGSCRVEIKYQATCAQIKALTDLSDSCKQFLSYTAYASVMWWQQENQRYAWWETCDGKIMENWGGAPSGTSGCACSISSKGCKEHHQCNADCNTHQETVDAGFLTEKDSLPVAALYFGDTGTLDDDEYGFYELGPLQCLGGPTKVELEIPVFITNTEYSYRYELRAFAPGECHVEFEVQACNDAFIGFSEEKGEQKNLVELNIGGWGNSKTVFRECRQCSVQADWKEHVLSCESWTGYWVDWCDGSFHFGRQGEFQSLFWSPPRSLSWRYLAYSTGYGSNGKFRFTSYYAKEIFVCERETVDIKCKRGKFIDVIWANYGRSDRSVCPHDHIKTTNCASTKSHSVMGNLCQGQKRCRLRVNNGAFGDPCCGTYKYLHMKYRCLPKKVKRQFTPEACREHNCNPRGGECIPVRGNKFQCQCKTDFYGEHCEHEFTQCKAWGDPHYTDFLGNNFNYQGHCKYILAMPCVDNQDRYFKIVGVNEPARWNDKVSFNRQLELTIGNTEIFLEQDKQIKIDNNFFNVPCHYGEDIDIQNDGKFVSVFSKDFGVKVLWDGKEVFKIYVDKKRYGENLCGLCGSLKPRAKNVFTMRDGTETTDIKLFGDSWTANPEECPTCDNCVSFSLCSNDNDLHDRVRAACWPLKDPEGVFKVGHYRFDPEEMFITCQFDLCSRPTFDDEMRCNMMEEYANRILLESRMQLMQMEDAILHWRNRLNCPYECPVGSFYSICASSCQPTCFQPVVPSICQMNCVEGCEVCTGFVMENGKPIPAHECGCRYENIYYEKGDKWFSPDCSQHCACGDESTYSCRPVTCCEHAYCGSQNEVHGCHCEANYIGDGITRCQLPCPSSMGNDPKLRELVEEENHAIIDLSRPITCEGYIKAFTIKRKSDSMAPVTLIVWRQDLQDPSKFFIVGSALLTIDDDSMDLCTCDNSKIPVRVGDYIGFKAVTGTVYYDETDPKAGEVWAAPFFDSVEPLTEVQFSRIDSPRAYSIKVELESSDGKHVEAFMFSSYLGVQSGRVPDEAMTASSALGNYVASKARLDNTDFGACSWTAEIADTNQWLQVDLGRDMLIIGVVTQGHCGIKDDNNSPRGCVTQFKIQYSNNGDNFEFMTDGHGIVDSFEGQCHCQKHVKNFFAYEVMTRFIRFIPVTWKRAISLRVDIIGRDEEVDEPEVDESQEPADETDNPAAAVAFVGRPFRRDGFLKGLKYCQFVAEAFSLAVLRPEADDSMNFGLVGNIYITSSGEDKVQVFMVREESDWIPVQAGDILALMFEKPLMKYVENRHASSRVLVTSLGPEKFKRIGLAGKISFTEAVQRKYPCLRPKFKASTTTSIPPVMSTGSLGIADGQVRDEQITSSGVCDSNSAAWRVRLGLQDQQGQTGGWCGRQVDQTAYVQVDFRKVRRCGGVVTQGFSSMNRFWFVQKYIIKCSIDMTSWTDITDKDGNPVMFSGNFDQDTQVTNYFSAVMSCRSLRIIPMHWEGDFPGLRMDVLGLPDVRSFEPEIGFGIAPHKFRGSGGFTFVMPDKKFEAQGRMTGVRFLACKRGSFELFVFRPKDRNNMKYTIVGKRSIRVKKTDVEIEIKFKQKHQDRNGKYIAVKKGDMIGLSFRKSVLYKAKSGGELTEVVYSRNRDMRDFRKLRCGKDVAFSGSAQRAYSLLALFQGSDDEESLPVDAQEPLGLENGQFLDDGISVSSFHVSEELGMDFSSHSCRLKYIGPHGGSWAPAFDETEPWIQVDTRIESVFTGVVTQGHHGLLNWWVTRYRVSYSTVITVWNDVLDCSNNQAIFEGNSDSDTEVTRYFCNPVNGRYFRIYMVEWFDHAALRFEVLGEFETAATEYGPSCIDRDNLDTKNYILLLVGAPLESDGYITELHFFPKCDSPFVVSVWRPHPTDGSFFKHIGSTDIPGQPSGEVATYRLDKDAYIPFKEGDVLGWSFTEACIPYDEGGESVDLFFSPNGGKLIPTPIGRYRLFTSAGKQAYSITALVTLSGGQSIPAVACKHGLGMESELIPDQDIETASILKPEYGNSRARLNVEAMDELKGCWAPSQNLKGQYIQVNLGQPSLVTGVKIRGCEGERRWVTRFRVELSLDLKNWRKPSDNRGRQVFYGNTDSDTVVEVFFSREYKAQHVRITVEEWDTEIGLRFDVVGCPAVCEEVWGAQPLVRNWRRSQCDRTFVVNTKNPISCNSFIKGWKLIPRHRASVTFYVLKPIDVDQGVFSVVAKTHVPKSKQMKRGEVYEVKLDKRDWIQVRSGHMIGFSSRKRSPIYIDTEAQDKIGHIIGRTRKIRKFERLDAGDTFTMKSFKPREAMYSFIAILTQEGVGKAVETVPPISCSGGLGMENRAIPDEAITVSSSADVLNQGGDKARLNGEGAWAAGLDDPTPYIQLDFGYVAKVTGISTQGDPVHDSWVISYSVEFTHSIRYLSNEPQNFQWISFLSGIKDIFPGNTNQNEIKTNFFREAIEARYVRLWISEFHNLPSMRLEYLGCPNADPCKPNPCQNGALCRKTQASLGYSCNCPMEWGGKNCDIRTYKCCAYGDPHYCNFDGQKFNFQGNCRYVLARTFQTSLKDHFEITADNLQSTRRPTVSSTREVYIRIGDKFVEFRKKRVVYVNGERINCPYDKDGISIVDGINCRVVLKTEFGLTVTWDGKSKVDIHLTEDYRNEVEGLCGNYNGEKGDDFIPRGSERHISNINEFGESWGDDPECEACEDCNEEDICRKTGKLEEAQAACSVLVDKDSPFTICHDSVNPMDAYESCMFDFCAMYPCQNNLCEDIQAYADECTEKSIQVGHWRKSGFCALDCPVGMTMNQLGTLCPNTCGDPDAAAECTAQSAPMCVCKAGLLLEDGNKCVEESQCGCMYQGQYYKKGVKFTSEDCDEICECVNQEAVCKAANCGDHASCKVQDGVRGCFCDEGWYGNGFDPCEEILEPKTVTVCEGGELNIDCSDDYERIEILTVDYGDYPVEECPDTQGSETSDSLQYALTIIRHRCHGQGSCRVSASSLVFGSFQDNKAKSLFVRYQCRETVPVIAICHSEVELVSCEDNDLDISCGELKIDVINAEYGRQQGELTCSPEDTELEVLSEDCKAPSAFRKVVEECHGNHMCTVHTAPDFFGGDPCPGISKYVRILYRCIENPDNKTFEEDKCDPNPCVNGDCEAVSIEPKYNCKCRPGYTGQHCDIGTATCKAFGDPHYLSFDNRDFDFMGHCKYTLVKNADGEVPDFEIIVYNEAARRRPSMSSTVQVEIFFREQVILLKYDGHVSLNGRCSEDVDMGFLHICIDKPNVIVRLDIGVEIRWDGRFMVEVDVTGEFFGHTEGLCGTYNGNPDDDFLTRMGETVDDPLKFGRSWYVEGKEDCVDCEDCVLPDACDNAAVKNAAQEICDNIINEEGPFRLCHDVLPPSSYFKHCLTDRCAMPEGLSYCNDYQAYAEDCQFNGITVNWKRTDFCYDNCTEKGMMYNPLGSSCPATCANPHAPDTCNLPDREACVCPDGMCKEGGECVPTGDCGCTDQNGRYIKKGETIIEDDCSKICNCEGMGNLQCNPYSCGPNEVCGIRDDVTACICADNCFYDSETGSCEVIPVEQILVRPHLQLDCATINCGDEYINILEANFGPRLDDICLVTEEDQGCNEAQSLDIMLNLCQGKHECSLDESTKQSFGEPCPEAHNYIYTKFTCAHKAYPFDTAVGYSLRVCQGRSLNLVCPEGKVVTIDDAFFGRRANDRYCLDDGAATPAEDVSDPEALQKAVEICDSSQCRCFLHSNNFGDPWDEGTEYLEVHYSCIPTS